jgi:DNA polymerase III subunit epsilon
MFGLFKRGRRRSVGVNERVSISEARYVVIDTELTGLNEKKDSILSFGAVRMTGGRIELNQTFYRLVSPGTPLTAANIVVHEIVPSEVAAKPGIETVLGEFRDFCRDDVLVGHFLSIDLGFLDQEVKRLHGTPLRNPVLDTFSMHEWLRLRLKDHPYFLPPTQHYRLYDIAKSFGIPVNGAHNALMDAFMTAQIFQRMIPIFQASGVQDIGDLLKIGIPFEGGESAKSAEECLNL